MKLLLVVPHVATILPSSRCLLLPCPVPLRLYTGLLNGAAGRECRGRGQPRPPAYLEVNNGGCVEEEEEVKVRSSAEEIGSFLLIQMFNKSIKTLTR